MRWFCKLLGHKWIEKLSGQLCSRCRIFRGTWYTPEAKLLTKFELALVLALAFVGWVCLHQDRTIQSQKALIRQLWGDCDGRKR